MQPVSGSNLAAALGGVGSATGTGGKPVSVDNLRAALGAVAYVLYDDPVGTKQVTLREPATGFDAIAFFATYTNANPTTFNLYEICLPDCIKSGKRTQGFEVRLRDGSVIYTGEMAFALMPDPTATTLSLSASDDYHIKRVLGLRFE